jgi:uncharacterized protein (UPF0332 family)
MLYANESNTTAVIDTTKKGYHKNIHYHFNTQYLFYSVKHLMLGWVIEKRKHNIILIFFKIWAVLYKGHCAWFFRLNQYNLKKRIHRSFEKILCFNNPEPQVYDFLTA